MRASGINRAFMQARSLSAGPEIAPSSAAGMPSGSEGNAQPASGACAIAFPARAPASVAVIASTAEPATLAITLHADLFILSLLPLLVTLRARAQPGATLELTTRLTLGERSNHWQLRITRIGGALDGLRHERGRRHVDLAACDVGRGTSDADGGHNASALTRLCFDFAAAPH